MNNNISRSNTEIPATSGGETPATHGLLKEDLLNMLDIAYELEGVLHLALTRGDDMPEALPQIIREKVEELYDWLPEENYVLEENPAQENTDSRHCEFRTGQEDTVDDTVDDIADDTVADTEDNTADDTVDDIVDEAEEETVYDAEEDAEEDIVDGIEEEFEEDAVEEIARNRDRLRADTTLGDKNPPAFSLNDRFLFTRELFNGSRKKFDEALDRLAQFDSIEEAEAYFYDDCALDPSEETVIDFMHIVEGYLKNR